jgi:hypothetical protein
MTRLAPAFEQRGAGGVAEGGHIQFVFLGPWSWACVNIRNVMTFEQQMSSWVSCWLCAFSDAGTQFPGPWRAARLHKPCLDW